MHGKIPCMLIIDDKTPATVVQLLYIWSQLMQWASHEAHSLKQLLLGSFILVQLLPTLEIIRLLPVLVEISSWRFSNAS